MKTRLCVTIILIFLVLSAPHTPGAAAHRSAAPQTVIAADLVIGVPQEDLGITTDAGAVDVLYNSGSQPYSLGNQFWNQGSPGVGTVHNRASFGNGLAVGDFDGDGHDDLAIGAFEATPNVLIDASGAVYVLYADHNGYGLTSAGDDIWTQDSSGVPGVAEIDDGFGYSVAAGDFNGDGYDDLAVGVPNEAVGTLENAGAVNILYGSASGLTGTGSQLWDQDSTSIAGTAEANDNFGYTLAAGDFDKDGYDDLAAGVWQEDVNGVMDAGAVNVLYGSADRITAAGNQLWDQDNDYIGGAAQTDAHFGIAMASGDFNKDGYADLAVGAPGYSKDATHDGALCLLHGVSSGLIGAPDKFWSLDSLTDPGQNNDAFASVLASGDFTNDGHDDLAVGVPSRSWNGAASAGMVCLMRGDLGDLSAGNNLCFTQEYAGQDSQPFDYFGASLAVGHLNADGYDDLAIGVPGKDVGTTSRGGMVIVMAGYYDLINPSGLLQNWTQDSPGILDAAETNDDFGGALAIGNFGHPADPFLLFLPIETR